MLGASFPNKVLTLMPMEGEGGKGGKYIYIYKKIASLQNTSKRRQKKQGETREREWVRVGEKIQAGTDSEAAALFRE